MKDNEFSCCNKTTPLTTLSAGKRKRIRGYLGVTVLILAAVLVVISATEIIDQDNDPSSQNQIPASCDLPSIDAVDWLHTDSKVAFLFFGDGRDGKSREISKTLQKVVLDLNKTPNSAEIVQVDQSHANHKSFRKKYGVTKIPAIVVLGRGCMSSTLDDNFTAANLLQSYINATTPASSCNSVGSSCCS